MTEVALKLKDQLLSLSEDDRAELLEVLQDSLPYDVEEDYDSAWIAELNRRADDLKAGRAIEEPAEQVLAELREECLRENEGRLHRNPE